MYFQWGAGIEAGSVSSVVPSTESSSVAVKVEKEIVKEIKVKKIQLKWEKEFKREERKKNKMNREVKVGLVIDNILEGNWQ